jgi:hypothetical protein
MVQPVGTTLSMANEESEKNITDALQYIDHGRQPVRE